MMLFGVSVVFFLALVCPSRPQLRLHNRLLLPFDEPRRSDISLDLSSLEKKLEDFHIEQHSILSPPSHLLSETTTSLFFVQFGRSADIDAATFHSSHPSSVTVQPRTYLVKLGLSEATRLLRRSAATGALRLIEGMLPEDKTRLRFFGGEPNPNPAATSYVVRYIVTIFDSLVRNGGVETFREELSVLLLMSSDEEVEDVEFEVVLREPFRLLVSTSWASRGRMVGALCRHPNVVFVEVKEDLVPKNSDARSQVQGGSLPGSPSLDPLWSEGLTGEGQIVAVMDTGIQSSNCMFSDESTGMSLTVSRNVDLANHRKFVRIESLDGDFCDGSTCIGDSNGHGTHVAGTIAGKSESSPDNGLMSGAAKDAKIYMQTFMNVVLSDGLSRGYDAGARVHSDSWGCGLVYFVCSFDCDCVWTSNPFGETVGETVDSSFCLSLYGTERCCEGCNQYLSYSTDMDTFLWENDEMLVLIAAGNDGESTLFRTVGSPATAKSPISVGSSHASLQHTKETTDFKDFYAWYAINDWLPVEDYYPEQCCNEAYGSYRANCCPEYRASLYSAPEDSEVSVSSFSSRGPTKDGRYAPTLVAPGENVLSARSNSVIEVDASGYGSWYNKWDNVSYCNVANVTNNQEEAAFYLLHGTSMATPALAGVATLVRQYFVEGYYPTQVKTPANSMATVSGALLKAVLMNSADASFHQQVVLGNDTVILRSGFDGVSGLVNNYVGFGIPRVWQTLFPNADSGEDFVVIDRESVSQDDVIRVDCYLAESGGSGVLTASMAYYDKPGTLYAERVLVNQVNLLAVLVRDSETSLSWGNGGSGADSLNPNEKIILSNLLAGDVVCLYLLGTDVDVDGQAVSMAISTKNLDGSYCPALDPNTGSVLTSVLHSCCEDGNRTYCQDHGVCSSGLCDCDSNWGGPFCETYKCADGNLVTSSSVCNGRGKCDSPGGSCTCWSGFGFYGTTCSEFNCTEVENCREVEGYGECIAPQVCDCENGYVLPDCHVQEGGGGGGGEVSGDGGGGRLVNVAWVSMMWYCLLAVVVLVS